MRKVVAVMAIWFVLVSSAILIICLPSAREESAGEAEPEGEGTDRELTDLSTLHDNSIKGPQKIDMSSYRLKVFGNVRQEIEYTYEDVVSRGGLERYSVLYCVEGWDAAVVWEGTRIMDLVLPSGPEDDSKVLVFHSADGYTTSLPLDEIAAKEMLIAYGANGKTLPVNVGYPFIVVAQDKLGYKWARWVIGIEVSKEEGYLGYWERRGYPNDADVEDWK
ncbi:MAG TPA: molybdopterin-dependent oxidoreductase [Bacillota bacterium]|nr:MAG: Sulfoxide reductase catalytic subunit YedY precursor [Firmicutes bacterium ADurb.Bin153]HNV35210.1 molybdopterin-dependent oxidoreductase [Bacillota bacterium]